MIAVVDYGAGNLRSVANALEHLSVPFAFAREPGGLTGAEKILLPGVGHFGHMMAALKAGGMDDAIRSTVLEGKPLLGICLGMQALFEDSEEAPGTPGLGLLPGSVQRFDVDLPVPQIGWNQVHFSSKAEWLYFANSFYLPVGPFTEGAAEYGTAFSASVRRDNVFGFQFHPEKSGSSGLQLLKRWCMGAC